MAMRRVVPTRSRAGTLAVGVLATLGVLTGLCGFVPSIALATDLSTDSCTAQDVTLGNGFILNEPCVCSPGGTFAAGTPDCPGKTTLTASPSGLASYTWFDGTRRSAPATR